LILTKPLGTGAIFAADMRGEARGDWVDGAIATMLVSNRWAAEYLQAHGAGAATDVTGFGLLGHLIEILNASGARAEIDLDRVPSLAGAEALIAGGITSSLQPANEAFASAFDGQEVANTGRRGLLFDPQTAGGLLASLPAERAEACLEMLRKQGYAEAAVIGRVVDAAAGAPLVALRG
jgi:selenide,water dikinase